MENRELREYIINQYNTFQSIDTQGSKWHEEMKTVILTVYREVLEKINEIEQNNV